MIDGNDDDHAEDGELVDDADYEELINHEFLSPFDQEIGPIGATIMQESVLFAQYSNCHQELY